MLPRFRLYREIEEGEFFVVFGDTAQGGTDKNQAPFLSKTKLDFPLEFSMHGVAAEATPLLHQALEWIFDKTKIQPVFAFERQNGGASEMYNLMKMNRSNKYRLAYVRAPDGKLTDKPGWDTNEVTRARMIGDWKIAYETQRFQIYDEEAAEQHQTFVVNKNGKPEAETNMHDDSVMAHAGAYQLFLTENPPTKQDPIEESTGDIKSLIY